MLPRNIPIFSRLPDLPEVSRNMLKGFHCFARSNTCGYCRLSNLSAAISPISSEFERYLRRTSERIRTPESNELGKLRERRDWDTREIDPIQFSYGPQESRIMNFTRSRERRKFFEELNSARGERKTSRYREPRGRF